jgi:sugar phosphate isomerase/epimerase
MPHIRLAVSSWSVNHALTRGDFTLLELPRLAAHHGLGNVEVCHFHFPAVDGTLDSVYLRDFGDACRSAGVTFLTFLQDKNDITHPDPARREEEITSIERAIDYAAIAGAARIRVIAGDAEPSGETLRISADGLLRLARYGADKGVRVVTENWHLLLDQPADVLRLLELTEGKIGLKLDFGNWPASRKYEDLPRIAPFTECTHAKAEFPSPGVMDEIDFKRCLDICRAANFAGPHVLIFASPGDEWDSLDLMRDVALPYVDEARLPPGTTAAQ